MKRIALIIGNNDYAGYDIVDMIPPNGTDRFGLLLSKEGIRAIKVFEVTEKGSLPIKKGNVIYRKKYLDIDQAIAFCCETGELYPRLFIEYIAYDYMKVKFAWQDNLKSGVFSENVRKHHTIRSILYYMCR